jgi:hypothetical protein
MQAGPHRLDALVILPRLAMEGMMLTPLAELLDFHTTGIILAVLFGCVVALLALCASQRDDHTVCFFSHCILPN